MEQLRFQAFFEPRTFRLKKVEQRTIANYSFIVLTESCNLCCVCSNSHYALTVPRSLQQQQLSRIDHLLLGLRAGEFNNAPKRVTS